MLEHFIQGFFFGLGAHFIQGFFFGLGAFAAFMLFLGAMIIMNGK